MNQRQIKFRAKRTDNHPVYWAYGLLVKTPITAEFNANDGSYFDSGGNGRWCIVTDNGVAHEIDINTLGQFTGLIDKNGKEIYEGDIMKLDKAIIEDFETVGKISWNYGCFEFVGNNHAGNIYSYDSRYLEVIGDIHSTPELIKL